jgi:crossover junction endodeoxyribonuclease RuvC
MTLPTLAAANPAATPNRAPRARARILGLDPGSIVTGYAILECSGQDTSYVTSGGIRAKGADFCGRLQDIFRNVARLVEEYRPDEIAIERVFMHRNPDSALKLGQARGAALCATFGVQARVYEYAPRQVKLAVVGTGAAQKEQVQLMVGKLLGLDATVQEKMGSDAADALAIALCHAHSRRLDSLLAAAGLPPPASSKLSARPSPSGSER